MNSRYLSRVAQSSVIQPSSTHSRMSDMFPRVSISFFSTSPLRLHTICNMLRVLRHLTRPASSSLTGRNISSFNVLNNGKSLCRAAASRPVANRYQTHDMCSSLLPLNDNGFELPTSSICNRAFSSADAETLNQVRESHLNFEIHSTLYTLLHIDTHLIF